MPCIFDIKPEDRHCEYCSAWCDERPKEETSSTTNQVEQMRPMDIKEIVKQYLEKGERCREQSAEHHEQGAFNFWDGFVSCAENILRELE
jgi:hypothetical protein